MEHFCSSSPGSSGGPFLYLRNQKVIWIHKDAANKGKEYNYGTFLKLPIEKFNEILTQNNNLMKNLMMIIINLFQQILILILITILIIMMIIRIMILIVIIRKIMIIIKLMNITRMIVKIMIKIVTKLTI